MDANEQYIIALDLDETLLNSKMELSFRTLSALSDCKNKGFILVISSTRGYGSCEKIAKKIGADFVCCQSGNMIVDANKNILYKNGFSKNEIAEFVDYAKQFTTNITIDSDFNLFGNIGDQSQNNYWGIIQHDINDLSNMNAYKFCVGFEPEYKDKLVNFCKQKGYVCNEMRTAPCLLVTPGGSDKFYALQQLAKMLGTDLEHLVVFGDDRSDLLSIEKAKYGVAMANSKPEVLNAANYVTESNDNDGVAAFLEKNF